MSYDNLYTHYLALSQVLQFDDMYERRLENDSSGRPIYVGKTLKPNALTSEKCWNIIKIHYDSNGFTDWVQKADEDSNFIYAWDDRATLFSWWEVGFDNSHL